MPGYDQAFTVYKSLRSEFLGPASSLPVHGVETCYGDGKSPPSVRVLLDRELTAEEKKGLDNERDGVPIIYAVVPRFQL